jgi:uncharacterized membrane protein
MPSLATLTDWLFLLHLLAAMIWVGGAVTLSALTANALRSADGEVIARFISSVRLIGPVVLAPAVVAVTGFGIWLVIDSDAWDFGQTWVWLALVFVVAAFLVGAIFQSRAMIRAQRASEAGDHGEAARQLRRWLWGLLLILLLLLLTAWDMVFKPGF